jgi:hypothetical protein
VRIQQYRKRAALGRLADGLSQRAATNLGGLPFAVLAKGGRAPVRLGHESEVTSGGRGTGLFRRAGVGLQLAGPGEEFLQLAFDRGIADLLILKDAVGINRESVGNGSDAEQLRD